MNDHPPANLVELRIPRPQIAVSSLDDSIAFAAAFSIVDKTTADIASAELNAIADGEKALKDQHALVKRPILEAGRQLDSMFRPYFDKAEQAKALWKKKLAAYIEAEQSKEREAQVKARELHRLEQERLAHEAAKREEEARVAAEKLRLEAKALADAGNATASAELERRADHAESAGQQDAQQMIEQLSLTAAEEVEPAALPSGVSSRQNWGDVDVYDLGELVCACAEGKQPMRYVLPNLVVLRQSAVALKDEFNVPGVRVRPRTIIARKSR